MNYNLLNTLLVFFLSLVGMNGLEPLRLSACEFESHVSTNSTTSP